MCVYGGEGGGGGEEWGTADTHHYGQGALYHVNVFSDTLSVTVPCHVPELPPRGGAVPTGPTKAHCTHTCTSARMGWDASGRDIQHATLKPLY